MDGPATGQWVAPWTFPEIFANSLAYFLGIGALSMSPGSWRGPFLAVTLEWSSLGRRAQRPGVSHRLSAGSLERVQVVVFRLWLGVARGLRGLACHIDQPLLLLVGDMRRVSERDTVALRFGALAFRDMSTSEDFHLY